MDKNLILNEQKRNLILTDYSELISEFFDGKDIKRIANDLSLSERTINNYINGSIPDSISGKAISSAILEKVIIILNEKKVKLDEKLTK